MYGNVGHPFVRIAGPTAMELSKEAALVWVNPPAQVPNFFLKVPLHPHSLRSFVPTESRNLQPLWSLHFVRSPVLAHAYGPRKSSGYPKEELPIVFVIQKFNDRRCGLWTEAALLKALFGCLSKLQSRFRSH